ncbi:protein draper-like, partial [Bombyx mandarina]|uniref:Protein draper-like n=1 Tax=Bombyx mandarina TaxID=7092 RepID=A0A6J2JNX1_BOMMA
VCQCRPGWRGAQCGEACGPGWWGINCSQPCRCAHGAACRPIDGYCRCPPGYTGNYCTQFCPEGYFGDHCMEACNCPSAGNWVCDPVRGCVCQRGFIGEGCDQHASEAVVIGEAKAGSNSGLIAVVIILALLCAAAIVLVLLYYRNRVKNLKREIAHVVYTADPHSQPEQQHFDNPVYSYQGSTRSDDSASLLNNATHIVNNLGTGTKLSNTTIEKLRMKATASNDAYDPMSSIKNKDADANNPNLYQYVEDNKLDHVYDEIKHKEGYEIEYDHLNYTPPANKWKPHYHRMPNGLTASNAQSSASSSSNGDAATPPIPPLPRRATTPPPNPPAAPLAAPQNLSDDETSTP